MLEPSSTDCWISVANERASSRPSRSPKMLERFAHGAAGADLEIGHVDVGGERRIAIAELAADALERSLHRQARIGADHQQVHEIGKAGPVLELARLDALVDVHARPDIAGDAADDHDQPKGRAGYWPTIGSEKEQRRWQARPQARYAR